MIDPPFVQYSLVTLALLITSVVAIVVPLLLSSKDDKRKIIYRILALGIFVLCTIPTICYQGYVYFYRPLVEKYFPIHMLQVSRSNQYQVEEYYVPYKICSN